MVRSAAKPRVSNHGRKTGRPAAIVASQSGDRVNGNSSVCNPFRARIDKRGKTNDTDASPARLLHEVRGGERGAAARYHVVDDENAIGRPDRISVDRQTSAVRAGHIESRTHRFSLALSRAPSWGHAPS